MKSELGKWTLNAKKWRKENGYTTPEWMMYVENRRNISIVMSIMSFGMGMFGGYILR